MTVSRQSASFIDVVEAGESPAAFGQFEDEANGCVFPVVRRFLEWAVDLKPPVGFFVLFGAWKTLRGIGLALENFVITPQEILLVFYGIIPVGHREGKFRHFRNHGFVARHNGGFKFFPERRKIGLGEDVWN